MIEEDRRADRQIRVGPEGTAREVDGLRLRGAEQHVRLCLIHEERLYELFGRTVEAVRTGDVVATAVVAHEGEQMVARLRPQAPVVRVEDLRAPQLPERRPDPEHDVVG